MDFKTQTNQQPPAAPQPRPTPSAPQSGGSGGRKLTGLLVGLVLLVLVVVGALAAWQLKGEKSSSSVERDKYQAVFMTNGQVYFGKLDSLVGKYAELTDVYYLQVEQQNIQPGTGTGASNNAANNNANRNGTEQPQVSLTKLGQELHGPTDKMNIASDQILFWENLKDDSTVVKAIKDYQAKQ